MDKSVIKSNKNVPKIKVFNAALKKPNAILLRIYGVVSGWDFHSKATTFFRENVKICLEQDWPSESLIQIIDQLREQVANSKEQSGWFNLICNISSDPVISDGTDPPAIIIGSVVKYIADRYIKKKSHQTYTTKKAVPALILLKSYVLSWGLRNGLIQTQ